VLTVNAPGTQPDITFTYDNLGRVLTTSQTGHTITYAYDALSRLGLMRWTASIRGIIVPECGC
jgi:YD repeat-containing protein